jgi:hypothetical protein
MALGRESTSSLLKMLVRWFRPVFSDEDALCDFGIAEAAREMAENVAR